MTGGLIKDHHPAYIIDQYERKFSQLQPIRASTRSGTQGAALLSDCLFAGLRLRMAPHYSSQMGNIVIAVTNEDRLCRTAANPYPDKLDDYVTAQIFKALQPAALESAWGHRRSSNRTSKTSEILVQRLRGAYRHQRAARQYNALSQKSLVGDTWAKMGRKHDTS